MQRLPTLISWLGVVAFASLPAFAQSTTPSGRATASGTDGVDRSGSTYTPGTGEHDSENVDSYSQRGSAVAPTGSFRTARGGGPGSTSSSLTTSTPDTSQRRLRQHGPQSDNQTRRPGATNYTGGSSYRGGGPRDAHTVGSGGVSMMGDDFTAGRTGSATSGRIRVRAPSSNEDRGAFALHGYHGGAIGGGPRDVRGARNASWIITRQGNVEVLAPSRPIAWGGGPLAPRAVLERGQPALTEQDLLQLPSRKRDDSARGRPGLLAMDPTVDSTRFVDNAGIASAQPGFINATTAYPPLERAVGGGPIENDAIHQASQDLGRGRSRR